MSFKPAHFTTKTNWTVGSYKPLKKTIQKTPRVSSSCFFPAHGHVHLTTNEITLDEISTQARARSKDFAPPS